MSEKRPPSIARMRKPHSAAKMAQATADDGRRIVGQQSLRNALLAGLIVVIVFSMLWAMLSTLLNKIFPWMTIILGILVGLAIRRAGRLIRPQGRLTLVIPANDKLRDELELYTSG